MRKAELVACVRAGLISLDNACERYMLSEEEFLSWDSYLDRHGVSGLRTTRLQEYRKPTDHVSDTLHSGDEGNSVQPNSSRSDFASLRSAV